MDSLTQAILGAAVAESVAGKKTGRAAALTGAAIGTIPDLDIVLMPLLDEYQRIAIHRGYSHSFIFCVLLSFILTYFLKKTKWFSTISGTRLYIMCFLCLVTHILLDAFTTYGTQLFLPFADWRVSFDSIAIIDPLYTIPLFIGLLLSLFLYDREHIRRSLPNSIGLIMSSLYLLFTLANKQHIEKEFYAQLDQQQIPYNRILTVPVKIANVIWYGVAKNEDSLYIGKYNMLDENIIKFSAFPVNDTILKSVNTELANRLRWFSKGFYTVARKDDSIRVYNMQCDMQGIRKFGDYMAPTAFYYEITTDANGSYKIGSGMHPDQSE